MHNRAKVGEFKVDTGQAEARTPHSFDDGVLLRGICNSGVVSDLF